MVSFAHIADVHLGHRQYGLDQRKEDVRASFEDAVNRVISEDVDFVLLAGDLFHERDVDAETLDIAENQLSRLREREIDVVAVEGNHDAGLYREGLSWMEYLHKKDLLTLLAADFDSDEVFDPPSLDSEKVPGYVDLSGVRIFGVQYLGQRFTERIPQIVEAIDEINADREPQLTVLLAHFGVSNHIPGAPGVPPKEAGKLTEAVDYVALGHFHRRFEEGSIYNPGSLEAHSRRQAEWERGFYLVDVTAEGELLVRHESSRGRPYHAVSFDVSDSSNPEELRSRFEVALEKEKGDFSTPPLVPLTLKGELGFPRRELNLDWFKSTAESRLNALHVIVNDAMESRAVPSLLKELESESGEVSPGKRRLNRDELETAVLKRIASKDSRYKEESEELARVMLSTKRMLLSGEVPSSVAEELKAKRRELFPADSKEGEG